MIQYNDKPFFVLVQARKQGSDLQTSCPVRILKLFKRSLEPAERGLKDGEPDAIAICCRTTPKIHFQKSNISTPKK